MTAGDDGAARARFLAPWLARREPVDHRSRPAGLLPPLRQAWRRHGWSRVLDLGSGTGSNLRYLAPRLEGPQEWVLLDRDTDLLARASAPVPRCTIHRCRGDLADRGLEAVADAHLVTGSALLDLVSGTWLRRLVAACRDAAAGACFALTYDGTIRWVPADGRDGQGHGRTAAAPGRGGAHPGGGSPGGAGHRPPRRGDRDHDRVDDELVRKAVNAHQRRDKGLGRAAGPDAAPLARELFDRSGFRTWILPSPWRLDGADADLVATLLDGWVEAALEERPGRAPGIRAWARRRRQAVEEGAFALTVGHLDLLALPAAAATRTRRPDRREEGTIARRRRPADLRENG